jgi:serine/threonine-protein kinase
MLSASNTAMRPARRIGKYLITGRIGRGGMGHVYRGLDEMLEREVAVKTLTVEGSFDEESRRRFEIEAKAAAKLQHPNIVTVFELGEDRGSPFIAMEMLPGADLETLLRGDAPLLLQEKLQILIQVCHGLAYAHDHNIVHRDIKPSNIRILEARSRSAAARSTGAATSSRSA